MNKQHLIGATSEMYVAYRLSQLGYQIYFPFLTQSKCDLVVEIDGELKKVQVKTASKSQAKGHPFIQIRLAGNENCHDYKDGDFDLLAMVYQGRLWIFPWEFVKDKTSMSFSIFEPQGKPALKQRRDISTYEVTP